MPACLPACLPTSLCLPLLVAHRYLVAKKKMATSAETLCRYKPDAFKTFTEAVMNLKFEVCVRVCACVRGQSAHTRAAACLMHDCERATHTCAQACR